jgi:tetratricopeptide (TPR) repeat protein
LQLLHKMSNEFYKRLQVQAWYCLAYLYSQLSYEQVDVNVLIAKVQEDFDTLQLGIRTFGYRFYALGFAFEYLDDFEKSLEMFNRAIVYSEESGFTQLKGISFTGLAILARSQQDYGRAFHYHLKAIEILDRICVKSNLASAYYQLGITYQAIGETGKSSENFQEAIRLFTEMDAPKQVERVRRSLSQEERELLEQ